MVLSYRASTRTNDPLSMTDSTGTLSGTVTDHTGNPVREVYVALRRTNRFAITDSDGRYTLLGTPLRQYTVNYYREGYVPRRRLVILRDGETTLDVVLVHI